MTMKSNLKLTLENLSDWRLILILFLGLLIRAAISPCPGLTGDTDWMVQYVRQVEEKGLASVGDMWNHTLYPPGFVYQAMTAARIMSAFPSREAGLPSDTVTIRDRVGVRLGPILSDILIGVVLFAVISRLRDRGSGCAAAALYLFNPATICNSALCNYDSIPSLLVLATVICAGLTFERRRGGWMAAASCCAALAFVMKLQAVMILPMLGLLCLLYGSWRTVVFCAMAFLGISAVAYGPWLLAGRFDYLHKVFVVSFQDYPTTHVNSFNLWGLWFQMPVTTQIMGVTAESWGRLALIVTFVILSVPLVLRRRSLLAGARAHSTVALVSAYFCFAAFMVLTRMHERYVAPAVALMILAAFLDNRLMFAAVGLGITYTANLACVYFGISEPWKTSLDRSYYEQAFRLTFVYSRFLCSALNLAIFGLLTMKIARLTIESPGVVEIRPAGARV